MKSQQKLKKQRRLIKPLQTLSNTEEIRNHLYNNNNNNNNDFIENVRDLFNIENSNELDKKINNNNNDFIENVRDLFNIENSNKLDKKIINNDDFIENIRDLFMVLDFEPVLIKSGFEGNYLEHMSNGNNSLSFDEYLELIKPYLNDLINVYKTKGEWKLQLSAEISFVSQKPDSDETRVMYTRSFCEEIMSGNETEEIMEKLIISLLQKYQDNLQNKMKSSDFIFNGVNYLFYDFNRITISKGGSYIESSKWLKDKKCTINQKNNDNKCFQYATTLALNFNNIDKHFQIISKIKPFIDNYNWNDINFPTAKKDWNRFELNNKDVALNILYVPFNTKKIEIAYKSKYNLIRDNQIILLMISNGENWHYLAVKSLSRLLRGITSNHDGDYYCLNCFHSYRTENKLNVHKKICEDNKYCNIEMPSPNNNIIKYNQGDKSLKLPFIIYADLECLLKKIDTCYNNPDLLSTTKINQHIPSGYSIYTSWSFDKSNNKLSYYRAEDCMKRLCKDLKDHATKIIDFKKKIMIPLTKEEEDNYNKESICYICKKEFNNDKVRDHCHFTGKYRGAAHNTCNLRYKIPKNIPVIFHNGSTYDYHFIIKELACEFEGNFECIGENTEKYIMDEDFVRGYDKNDIKGYILEGDVDYPNELQNLHSDLPFLPERMVINNTKKLVCNLHDKKNYVVHINVLKQALDHGLKLKKIHRVTELDQEAWLKEYIDVNTELRKRASNDFEKDFFKLMNNAIFGKTMENVRKHRDIKLVKTDKKNNKLVSEPNYHKMKLTDNNLAIIEMRKVKVKVNKPIYLGLSILDISKIAMYEFWYDYVKSKYEDKARLCYMDTDSFVVNIKTKDFYKDIAENVKERFDTSNYIYDRPLPTGVNKKVIGLMKDELCGDIITEFVALRPKAYSYIKNDFIEMKKAKGTKKCVVKKMLRFEDYKKCLFSNGKVLKLQQRFKSENHSVYTKNINKIALSFDDDKRIVTSDRITSYPYGYILKN